MDSEADKIVKIRCTLAGAATEVYIPCKNADI